MLNPLILTPGSEQHENFWPPSLRLTRQSSPRVQYDYRHTDGELFSTTGKDLAECRNKRDSWLVDKAVRQVMEYRNADDAFDAAIDTGRLSADKAAETYAGNYMYMGHANGIAQFKHIDTRKYLSSAAQ